MGSRIIDLNYVQVIRKLSGKLRERGLKARSIEMRELHEPTDSTVRFNEPIQPPIEKLPLHLTNQFDAKSSQFAMRHCK